MAAVILPFPGPPRSAPERSRTVLSAVVRTPPGTPLPACPTPCDTCRRKGRQ